MGTGASTGGHWVSGDQRQGVRGQKRGLNMQVVNIFMTSRFHSPTVAGQQTLCFDAGSHEDFVLYQSCRRIAFIWEVARRSRWKEISSPCRHCVSSKRFFTPPPRYTYSYTYTYSASLHMSNTLRLMSWNIFETIFNQMFMNIVNKVEFIDSPIVQT